ncbi:MAG: hypothetical protein K6T57_03740 [Thermaceae bacterium]|nr:hypothetical protein [Thermaceae bacterium]
MFRPSKLEPLLISSLFLPFALQLLGWAGTPLGQGPCGTLGLDPLEAPQGFYAQMLLWGISLLMTLGFVLLMLRLMYNRPLSPAQARPWARLAGGLAGLTALVYLLSRIAPLPVPSPLGWLWAPPTPMDAVGGLMLAVWLGQMGLAWLWGQGVSSPRRLGA